MDRAEYTGTPVDLVIRVDTVLGSESLSVADFVRLARCEVIMRKPPLTPAWPSGAVARVPGAQNPADGDAQSESGAGREGHAAETGLRSIGLPADGQPAWPASTAAA